MRNWHEPAQDLDQLILGNRGDALSAGKLGQVDRVSDSNVVPIILACAAQARRKLRILASCKRHAMGWAVLPVPTKLFVIL